MIPPSLIFSKFKTAVFLVVLVAAANSLLARTSNDDTPSTPPEKSCYFLDINSIDVSVLPEPPADGSQLDDEDEDIRVTAIAAATRKQLSLAKDSKGDVFAFSTVFGADFNAKELPLTAALFKKIDKDSIAAINYAKGVFQRKRPSSDHNTTFSYPSGEATQAYIWASFLSDIFPDKATDLIEAARKKGWYRVILGCHYPSDTYAGGIYAGYLKSQFLANTNFQQELNAAAQEMKSVLSSKSKNNTSDSDNSSAPSDSNGRYPFRRAE